MTTLVAYVDETGTGGEGRMLLGAIVGHPLRWAEFERHWRRSLDIYQAKYAHATEMERSKAHFRGWPGRKKFAFVTEQLQILETACSFGATVSLDIGLYQTEYRDKIPPKVPVDSAYAVAAKELVIRVLDQARIWFPDYQVNFIWEDGHKNIGNVEKLFENLRHFDECVHLGPLFIRSKEEALPLQAVDQYVVAARQMEMKTKARGLFGSVAKGASIAEVLAMSEGSFPSFYDELTAEKLRHHVDSTAHVASVLKQKKFEAKQLQRG